MHARCSPLPALDGEEERDDPRAGAQRRAQRRHELLVAPLGEVQGQHRGVRHFGCRRIAPAGPITAEAGGGHVESL